MREKSKDHRALITVVTGAIILSSAIILVAFGQNRLMESLVLQPPSLTPTLVPTFTATPTA